MGSSSVGRPSNRDERYEQVMSALVRCVARFGLEGTTLGLVAKQAGLTRPLIRHHLGNRDDMIAALQDFVLSRFDADVDALIEALPDRNVGACLNEMLFSPNDASDPDVTLAFAALTAHARSDESLRERCRACILRMEAEVARALAVDIPDQEIARTTAHGIVALYFTVAAFEALDMPKDWQERARTVANSLLSRQGTPE